MKIKVKNLNGTGINNPKPTCKCLNWLDHWENNRKWTDSIKKTAKFCRRCKNEFRHEELVGGHVKIDSSSNMDYFIIPLCKVCNNKSSEDIFEVNSEDLVSANCSKCKNN